MEAVPAGFADEPEDELVAFEEEEEEAEEEEEEDDDDDDGETIG